MMTDILLEQPGIETPEFPEITPAEPLRETAASDVCEVEIITGLDCIYAFLVRGQLNPARRDHLYRMVPERFRLDIELTNLWGVTAVIADPYWAARQKNDRREHPPTGVRMLFVKTGQHPLAPLTVAPNQN